MRAGVGEGGDESGPGHLGPGHLWRDTWTALSGPLDDVEEDSLRGSPIQDPTPYTLHPTPYTLHPTFYTLHPTLHTSPYTINPEP